MIHTSSVSLRPSLPRRIDVIGAHDRLAADRTDAALALVEHLVLLERESIHALEICLQRSRAIREVHFQ